MQTMERTHDDPPPAIEPEASLSGPPNRRARRISLGRKVTLQIADREGFVDGCAQNVSETGMFVRCRTPRPPGTVVADPRPGRGDVGTAP